MNECLLGYYSIQLGHLLVLFISQVFLHNTGHIQGF